MPSKDDTYLDIITCIAIQLQFYSDSVSVYTSRVEVAKGLLPKDAWDYFTSCSWDDSETIELPENLVLELVRKSRKISANLKIKLIGHSTLILAKWQI